MPITCRECNSPIPEERISLDSGVACCPACGMLWRCATAPGRTSGSELPASGLPQGCSLTVEDSRLTLEYPVRNKLTLPLGIFILLFAAVWWGFLLFSGMGRSHGDGIFHLFSLAFSLPFWLMGIVELAAALFIFFGRVKVTIEPSGAQRRWALGPFGYTHRAALDETATCRWHELPFITTPQARPTRHQRPKLRPPIELVSGSGSLGFGATIAPENRRAIAQAINSFLDRAGAQAGALILPRTEPPHRAACPLCSGDLGPAAVEVRRMRLDCPHCGQSSPLVFERTRVVVSVGEDEEAARPVPRPEKTKIVIERPRPGQMAIYVPQHGFRGAPMFMLIFSIFWNTITFAVIGAFVADMVSKRRIECGAWPVIPMGILFFGVGVGMFYFALKGARSRKFLSIERDRIVLRTTFLNRNKDVSAERAPGQLAVQVVAYTQNERPIYKLSFGGTRVSFGSEMDQPEKDWLECEINRFLKGLDGRRAG